MTAAEIRDHVAGYAFRGFLADLGARVDLEAPLRTTSARIRVTVTVPDSVHGRPVAISRTQVVRPDSPAAIDRGVWAAVIDLLAHEAGEALLHDGREVFDPHKLPRTWPWA